jgi:hypothetical protein
VHAHTPQASSNAASEYAIKTAWLEQVFRLGGDTPQSWDMAQHFPWLRMINWVDRRKVEPDLAGGNTVDWSISSSAESERLLGRLAQLLGQKVEDAGGGVFLVDGSLQQGDCAGFEPGGCLSAACDLLLLTSAACSWCTGGAAGVSGVPARQQVAAHHTACTVSFCSSSSPGFIVSINH